MYVIIIRSLTVSFQVEDSKASKEEPEVKIPDSVYRELETIYGWIDSLDKASLARNLKKNNQNPNGTADSLRKRLKGFLRRKKLASINIVCADVKTLFPYYVVLDFEATCNEVNPPDFP